MTVKPTDAAATVPTPTAAEVNSAGPRAFFAPLPMVSRWLGMNLLNTIMETAMATIMPM